MKVLVGCETSGVVREAFRKLGHDAWSLDILPSDDDSPYHIQESLCHHVGENYDLAILHPPCTRLCNSGVRWLHERNLWEELDEAVGFFLFCLNFPCDHVCVENPVMHKYAKSIVGPYQQATQPWQFGDNFKKRTCFWLKNLPPLVPTSDLDGSTAYAQVHRASPGPNRWKIRSKTYQGIADAMATQWSSYLLEQEEYLHPHPH